MIPHAIVGTAGHIDHGKTALIKALTGQDTDRLKEEKERGISIDLGFAHLDLDDGRRVGIVDVPGHERFIRNMLAGAHGIDLALLVVAADDGVMPQTEEHVDILHLLGTRSAVVAMTKIDLVDAARIEAVREEIGTLLAWTMLEGAPIVPVSSATGAGLAALRAAIQARLTSLTRTEGPAWFRLPIDRAFVLHGHGLVVTGTAIAGTVREGETLRIVPGGELTRVRSVHVHNQAVREAYAGQRVALNLGGIGRPSVARGHIACSPALDRTTDRFDAWVEIRPGPRHAIASHDRVRVFVGTAEVLAKLIVLDSRSELGPGDAGFAQLALREPIAALRGDRFVLRDETSQRTIGGGEVVQPFAGRRRRNDPATLSGLAVLRAADTDAAVVDAVIALESAATLAPDFLMQAAHFTPERLQALLTSEMRVVALPNADTVEAVTSREKWDGLRAAAIAAVADFHRAQPRTPGIEMESVRSAVAPAVSAKVFRAVIDRLVAEKSLVRQESVLHLPSHRVALADADRELATRLTAVLGDAGWTPPDVAHLATTLAVPRPRVLGVLQHLEREGQVYRVAPDLYYAAAALERARAVIRDHCGAHPHITAATFRDLLNASRKFAIALLDYFDRTGFTLRVGDARKLRR